MPATAAAFQPSAWQAQAIRSRPLTELMTIGI